MSTTEEIRPARKEDISDPDTPMTVVVGVVGTVLVFVIVVVLQALFYKAERDEFARKVVAQPPVELRAVQSEQLSQINSYRWVDQQAGVVAIPIDRAMEKVVREHAASPAPAPRGR
jgi:hypothetical protein